MFHSKLFSLVFIIAINAEIFLFFYFFCGRERSIHDYTSSYAASVWMRKCDRMNIAYYYNPTIITILYSNHHLSDETFEIIC